MRWHDELSERESPCVSFGKQKFENSRKVRACFVPIPLKVNIKAADRGSQQSSR